METDTRQDVEETGVLQESAQYLGVVLDEAGVAEWEHGQRTVFVGRDDLRDLQHEFGWRSERPIAQGLLGAALLAAGLHLLVLFVAGILREGAIVLPKTFVAMGITLPMLGAWALWGAMRRGHFLRAALGDGDTRKLLFQGRFDATEFGAFVARARKIGYSIRTSERS